MRCYRLKNLLATLGYQATIYQRGDEDLSNLALRDVYCEWLETPVIEKILETFEIAVIDSYEAEQKIYEKIASLTKKIIVFDDNNRLIYPQNAVILNGALGAESLYPETPKTSLDMGGQIFLAGIEFLITDSQFFCKKTPKPHITDLLITFGGSDCTHNAEQIAHIIKDKPYTLHIISSKNPKLPKSKKIKHYPHLCPSEMARLMAQCDVGISAGGGTLNELAMAQVPTLIIPVATNQMFQAKNWEKHGAMKITNLSNLKADLEAIEPIEKRKEMIGKFQNIPFGKRLKEALGKILHEQISPNIAHKEEE
ncbi:hypothetical protein BJI48_06185 [Helicobacter sp. 11S02596-1]|nr:hypothetical protein BJI48_06185 [Helicobacter sp. 11S02596-1]